MGRARKDTTNAMPIRQLLAGVKLPKRCSKAREDLVRYVENNAYRMDYARYIKRGYQIGSGAMESLHRVASQLRLKRPGSAWLPETAKAIFNLRMMTLVDNEEKFWSQEDLTKQLVTAFQGAPGKVGV
jgi:hypothetical protein